MERWVGMGGGWVRDGGSMGLWVGERGGWVRDGGSMGMWVGVGDGWVRHGEEEAMQGSMIEVGRPFPCVSCEAEDERWCLDGPQTAFASWNMVY